MSVKDSFDVVGPSSFLDLPQRGFGEHVKTFDVVLLEHQLGHFFEETDLLEEQLNVQLLPTLHPALVVPLHGLPVQGAAEDFEDLKEAVPQKDYKVEVL